MPPNAFLSRALSLPVPLYHARRRAGFGLSYVKVPLRWNRPIKPADLEKRRDLQARKAKQRQEERERRQKAMQEKKAKVLSDEASKKVSMTPPHTHIPHIATYAQHALTPLLRPCLRPPQSTEMQPLLPARAAAPVPTPAVAEEGLCNGPSRDLLAHGQRDFVEGTNSVMLRVDQGGGRGA